MICKLIHFLGAATFGYATYYEFWEVKAPPEFEVNMGEFPGRWKYLTTWNLVLQVAYHIYSLINDLIGSNEVDKKKQRLMQRIRDGVFTSVIFPNGSFVSLTFWGLYSIDRELVFPIALDSFYPWWLNNILHTGPFVFLTMEILNVPRILPNRFSAIAGTMSFTGTYITWITLVFIYTGVWPYPVLQILNNLQRALFLSTLVLMILGLYFLGEFIQKFVWGNTDATPKAKAQVSYKSKGKSKAKKML